MSKISASEMADMYEMGGEDAKLNHDIKVMKILHNMEETWLDYKNDIYHEDCMYKQYDWEAMIDEDYKCGDKYFIPNLQSDLRKACQCPDHNHIHNDKKFKTIHLQY